MYHTLLYACTVYENGYVTPLFRVMTSTGDWVWMQMETKVNYTNRMSDPLYYEYKVRVFRYAYSNTCIYTCTYIHVVHMICQCSEKKRTILINDCTCIMRKFNILRRN